MLVYYRNNEETKKPQENQNHSLKTLTEDCRLSTIVGALHALPEPQSLIHKTMEIQEVSSYGPATDLSHERYYSESIRQLTRK